MITAAVVGAEVTRAHHPRIPYTPEEIADEAVRAWEAGAAIIHLHARRPDGTPTQDRDVYAEIIARIRARCDAILQVSTGGAIGMTPEERMAPLELQPEMATLTTGTVNFGDGVFFNPPDVVERFAREMKARGVRPEFEIFDVGMIEGALALVRKGLVEGHLHFDFVMGVPGGIPATVDNLVHLVRQLPPGATWTVAGVGRHQLPMAVHALVMGGHVRVGFEDNVYYAKGVLAESNAQLVERIVRLAREIGREVATPDEARALLGIPQRRT